MKRNNVREREIVAGDTRLTPSCAEGLLYFWRKLYLQLATAAVFLFFFFTACELNYDAIRRIKLKRAKVPLVPSTRYYY